MQAYPGKLLGSVTDYHHGQGTYVYLNQIYASTKGAIKEIKGSGEGKPTITVGYTDANADIQREGEDQEQETHIGQPKVGQRVYARITRIEQYFAKAEILAIITDEVSSKTFVLKTTFQGIIFREDARNYDHDSIDLYKCFRPGDIVKAKVTTEQLGGKENSTKLSTSDDDLGVILAHSEVSGVLLIPRSFT